MKSFSLSDALGAAGGKVRAGSIAKALNLRLEGVQTDSRKVGPGDLFLALKGPASDGHNFVETAFARGATAAMVSRAWADPWLRDEPLLIVEDTEIGLGRLAGWYAQGLPARRVGVTGSSGKTTTKEMIATGLSATSPTLKNEASQNGETGVPLTLLRMGENHRYAVLEMGMRGAGQIRYLAEIVKPEIGVITNIGPVHLEFLGSVENVARAKAEMLELLPSEGVAILPAEDAFFPLLRELTPCRIVTYGLDRAAAESTPRAAAKSREIEPDVRASDVRTTESGAEFLVRFPFGKEVEASIPIPGLHNVRNALAAFATTWVIGADVEAAAHALASFEPPAMRSGVLRTLGGATLLHDAYNANPDSMRAALDVLSSYPRRRVAILGDMLELGSTEEAEHRALGRAVAPIVDTLVTVGPRAAIVAEVAREAGLSKASIQSFSTTEEAVAEISQFVKEGDTVLLKGSRGMKMEVIADALVKGPSAE